LLERSQEQQQNICFFISNLASKKGTAQFASDVETFILNMQQEMNDFVQRLKYIKESLDNILQD
jgi:hypothetical protein